MNTAIQINNLPDIPVIDDNRDAADALSALLQRLGYTTRTAYSGADGIAIFDDAHPDVVFLDIAMPEMSG